MAGVIIIARHGRASPKNLTQQLRPDYYWKV
jgi:hypothetical protein